MKSEVFYDRSNGAVVASAQTGQLRLTRSHTHLGKNIKKILPIIASERKYSGMCVPMEEKD